MVLRNCCATKVRRLGTDCWTRRGTGRTTGLECVFFTWRAEPACQQRRLCAAWPAAMCCFVGQVCPRLLPLKRHDHRVLSSQDTTIQSIHGIMATKEPLCPAPHKTKPKAWPRPRHPTARSSARSGTEPLGPHWQHKQNVHNGKTASAMENPNRQSLCVQCTPAGSATKQHVPSV